MSLSTAVIESYLYSLSTHEELVRISLQTTYRQLKRNDIGLGPFAEIILLQLDAINCLSKLEKIGLVRNHDVLVQLLS